MGMACHELATLIFIRCDFGVNEFGLLFVTVTSLICFYCKEMYFLWNKKIVG